MSRPRLKRALVLLAAVAVGAIVLLCLPPVQSGLVRLVAGGFVGVDLQVERVWVGPWGAEVDGLTVNTPALELDIERIEADLGFWSSLGHLRLEVEELSASGVSVRLGPFVADSEDEASEPFQFRGLRPYARLPKRMAVVKADAEGTVEVLLANDLTVGGPWTVTTSFSVIAVAGSNWPEEGRCITNAGSPNSVRIERL